MRRVVDTYVNDNNRRAFAEVSVTGSGGIDVPRGFAPRTVHGSPFTRCLPLDKGSYLRICA